MRPTRLGGLVVLLLPAIASAAGLQRANVVGARAIGLGGAFTAVASDTSAVWHNPAGTAFFGENQAYLGLDLTIAQRTYTPDVNSPIAMLDPSRAGKTISEAGGVVPIPNIGLSTRFGFGKTKPTRFALSLLAYDVYGGSIEFKAADIGMRGTHRTQILNFEIAPALAYQVSDVISIGAALRIGINTFSVLDVQSAFKADLSASGVGIGGTLGILVKPHRMIDIGATYRTPMSATMTGSGPLTITGQPTENRDMSLSITWPQSAALAVAVKPHPRVMMTLQGDWQGWSSVQTLDVKLTGLTPQVRQMRFSDVFQLHFGVQGVITRYLLARVGYMYETSAVDDCCRRRENIDGKKSYVGAGLGLHFWRLFIDAAFEALVPVDDGQVVRTPYPNAMAPFNETGRYHSSAYSASLAATLRF